ncbi:MAG: enoyl-CoA hydratase [Candidatus Hydrogenedentes bacterium]|nr:enoyl-CoA hydratase [Candidatus Hydrogenedentota bacterium]
MPQDIVVTKKQRVLWIELNRPEARNAIRIPTTTNDLWDALNDAVADSEVRAIILTGRGPAFCAGGDVKEMAKALTAEQPDPTWAREIVQTFHRTVDRLYEIEKPTIAAVNGPAVGAGCNIALACDLRIASDQAKFTWAFVHRGLSSDAGSTFLLSRLVGPAKAFELLALGDPVSADEALRLGIVDQVVPHDQLVSAAESRAARFAAGPPKAIGMIKRGIRNAMHSTFRDALELEADLQAISLLGPEHREGVMSYLEKRHPKF